MEKDMIFRDMMHSNGMTQLVKELENIFVGTPD